jgi:hypothetical protein
MTQWIKSGVTDQYVYFQAPPGLSSFTVVGSRNSGSGFSTFTTPTVSELSSGTMPGLYALLLDEMTTMTAGNVTESLALHISASGWPGTIITVTLFDNLPADINQVLGTDISENAGDNSRNIGY